MNITTQFEPDCFDLNDWCFTCHPSVFEASRYLSPSIQYAIHKNLWVKSGKPDINTDIKSKTVNSSDV